MLLTNQVTNIKQLKPELLVAMMHINTYVTQQLGRPASATSLRREPAYGVTHSYHYSGNAVDVHCSSWGMRHDAMVNELRRILKPLGYDVVHETPETHGTPEHLHVEFNSGNPTDDAE